MTWRKLDGGEIDLYTELQHDISLYENDELKFYVGTDSQQKKKRVIYVTAIILYRTGIGGNVYYLKEKEAKVDMRTRLWNETYKAVEIAKELNDFLFKFGLRVDEVHADLNPDKIHKSNSVVQACLGFICGMGFEGKIKPHAWGASKVANKMTK